MDKTVFFLSCAGNLLTLSEQAEVRLTFGPFNRRAMTARCGCLDGRNRLGRWCEQALEHCLW